MLILLLRQRLFPYRRMLMAVVALQLLSTGAALFLPTLNADIIDKGVATGDTSYILRIGMWMLLITVAQIVTSIGAVYFAARTAMGFGRDVRGAVFHRVASFSEREVSRFGAPSLITRTTNDVQQMQQLVMMSCTLLVGAPISCIGGVILALRQDARLSSILAVSVPVLLVAVTLIVTNMVPQFRLMQGRIDVVNRILREQITGIRVVRAFVREPYETERFAKANRDLTDTTMRAGQLQALLFPTVTLVVNASSVAALWIGGHLINSNEMPVGALSAFLSYLIQILLSVMMATFVAVMFPRAAVSAERITEVLNTDSTVVAASAPITDITEHAVLAFDNVEMRYPGADEPVLHDVTLRLRAGQTMAVVGSTGSGKTTLISLIPRLFDVTRGSVTVDGVDVRQLDFEALRSRIGLVPQRPYLFTGTVASNLRYGKPDATDDELWQALEVAQARDFVSAMPDGLNSPIAQGGTNVSGGQRQRLAIARALVRKPEIYLFDDSFSALDVATDSRLRAALRPHTRDAAVLIVAQRISTVIEADQIVVLDDGKVVGSGTHDELLDTSPTYREIVDSQLSAGAAA